MKTTIPIVDTKGNSNVYGHTKGTTRGERDGCEGMWADEPRSQAGVQARNYQLLIVRFKLRVKLSMKQPHRVRDKRRPHKVAYRTRDES